MNMETHHKRKETDRPASKSISLPCTNRMIHSKLCGFKQLGMNEKKL